VWSDGYPSGGNYWSDYTGKDLKSGPYQNVTGSDGIGDTPYIIDAANIDPYPIVAAIRIHDIGVLNLSSAVVDAYVGWIVNVTAAVRNYGGYVESFNVTLYGSVVAVDVRSVTSLPVGETVLVSFRWNTSSFVPCSRYQLKANASAVVGETILANNVFNDGLVKIKMMGDVNGDGEVDILDIVAIAKSFDSHVGQPKYSILYDMNLDNFIDIVDITMAALNFDKSC
jgi:hypothetical protein